MAKRKRNSGEGSIFQRTDGRWCAQLDLGWEGGKRRRKYVYGATAGEVQTQLLKARSEKADGLPVSAEHQTVGQFLRDWLETIVRPSVRAATYRGYEQVLRNHLVPELGRITLRKLEARHIQGMLTRKLVAGLSPRSVAYLRVVLRTALNQALRWNLVARNVAGLVTPPKVERYKIRLLTPEQARSLLAAAKDHRLYALFAVTVACGLREGEILGLHWRDVDLEQSRLVISQALQRQKGRGLVLTEPKTERSRRNIALPPKLVDALRAHRAHQAQERLLQGPRWRDTGLVFTSGIGTPLEPRKLLHNFKALLRKAELPDVRFHDLRHSAASLMLAQGVPMRVVMEILGHSSISLTANTYSHVMPSLVQDATEKMAGLLFGP